MSAIFDAAAVGLTSFFVFRLLTAGKEEGSGRNGRARLFAASAAAVVGGLMLAFSTAFLNYALQAEVFPLNDFFAILLFVLLVEWQRRPQQTRFFWAFSLCWAIWAST